MIHELKTRPEFFNDVVSGRKRFELRKDDREFKVGDVLVLRGWSDKHERYMGVHTCVRVTYLFRHGQLHGLEEGYVILGISPCGNALAHGEGRYVPTNH